MAYASMIISLIGVTLLANAEVSLKLPNQRQYWSENGFHNMVGPIHLPTSVDRRNVVEVWLKLPEGSTLTVKKINDMREDRYTLVYPPGTIVDRIEYLKDTKGVVDVRGAHIDKKGATVWHVYRPVLGGDQQWLWGYEWNRVDDATDIAAGEHMIPLFFPNGETKPIESFRRLNRCTLCHQENAPTPLAAFPIFPFQRLQSDSHGFFQPMTSLQNEMTVRRIRPWDLNADDPFVSVWCGVSRTTAVEKNGTRVYECPDNGEATGKLDIAAALATRKPHALDLCAARVYLFKHMDGKARAVFASAFRECNIR